MNDLFSPEYLWLWTSVLGAALFFPVRQLIWVLSVRRLETRQKEPSDEAQQQSLKRRASITSALLCLVFSAFYVSQMLGGNR